MTSKIVNFFKELLPAPSQNSKRSNSEEFDSALSSAEESTPKTTKKFNAENEKAEKNLVSLPVQPFAMPFNELKVAEKLQAVEVREKFLGDKLPEIVNQPVNRKPTSSPKRDLQNEISLSTKESNTPLQPIENILLPAGKETQPVSLSQQGSEPVNQQPAQPSVRNNPVKPAVNPYLNASITEHIKDAAVEAQKQIRATSSKRNAKKTAKGNAGEQFSSGMPLAKGKPATAATVKAQPELIVKSSVETKQKANEHGSNPQHEASAKSVEDVKSTPIISSTTRLMTEQIRELQALVQRALESSHSKALNSGEATFEWSAPELGNMKFHFSTKDSNVNVEIIVERPFVADIIEQSKRVVEQMILDQGLRLERLDVQIRDSSKHSNHEMKHTNDRESNHRQTQNSLANDSDSLTEPTPQDSVRRHLTGERKWVA